MKKIVTIQDISCVGKCSLTVALPIISATGVEAAIIPTAVLSTHTMFKNFTCKDLDDQILPIAKHWKSEGLSFDAFYTGYLASAAQIDKVINLIEDLKNDKSLVIVDPAMADNGKLYPAFDENFPKEMAKLCAVADIALPNITEACYLTGTPYRETYDEAFAKEVERNITAIFRKKSTLPITARAIFSALRLQGRSYAARALRTASALPPNSPQRASASPRTATAAHGTALILSWLFPI